MITEVAALNQIRLDEDLLLSELEEQIGIDQSTLSRMFSDDGYKPMDRTLHKIRRFLENHKTPKRAKRVSA